MRLLQFILSRGMPFVATEPLAIRLHHLSADVHQCNIDEGHCPLHCGEVPEVDTSQAGPPWSSSHWSCLLGKKRCQLAVQGRGPGHDAIAVVQCIAGEEVVDLAAGLSDEEERSEAVPRVDMHLDVSDEPAARDVAKGEGT